jgi:hypothetical protein
LVKFTPSTSKLTSRQPSQ